MEGELEDWGEKKRATQSTAQYKIRALAGKVFIAMVEKLISLFTPDKFFFETEDFSWIKGIEQNYPRILEEFRQYFSEAHQIPDICDISEEQFNVVKLEEWKFIPLYIYTNKIESYCRKLPVTTAIVEGIPGFTTVFFSILNPHVKVAEHRGAYKGYLRYHLGVSIPEPVTSCGLQIENKVFRWHNGKSIVFDDTYRHSAWNESDQIRVVLYVDFIRPLPGFLKKASVLITKLLSRSPYVQNALTGLVKYQNREPLTQVLG